MALASLAPQLYRRDAVRWLSSLAPGSIDHFITDPPYGVALKLSTKSKVRLASSIRGDGRLEARKLWERFVPLMAQAARPDSLHMVFSGWSNNWALDVLREHFRVTNCIVWHKRPPGLGHFTRSAHEEIYLLAKGSPPRLVTAQADVWQLARVSRPVHPCQKPVPLLIRCMELVSLPGALVADPFSGIASTAVAAIQCGRRFVGCELDPQFVKFGRGRIRSALADAESRKLTAR